MQTNLLQDLKSFMKSGNMVTKLIIFNLAFTVFLFLINVIIGNSIGSFGFAKYFLVSDSWYWDLTHPWVFITHLFISSNVMDLIWNMLILYWFGAIIGDMIGDDKVLPAYILGGVFGAIVYVLFMNIFGLAGSKFISGCNTAVLSLTVASAVLVPNYNMRLLFFGNVSLKVVVTIYVLLQLIYAYTSYNDILYSLIGGVVFGWIYIYSLGKSWRLDIRFNSFVRLLLQFFSFLKIGKHNMNLSVKYKSKGIVNTKKSTNNNIKFDKKLDEILKKIKDKGYESLDDAEKEFLFLASKD